MKEKSKKNYIKQGIALFLLASLVTSPIGVIGTSITTAYADEAKISSLAASYSGEAVQVGEEIDKSKLTVTAVYENGETETLTDYTIVSTKVASEGVNLMMVIYQGKTANFYVTGKALSSVSAYYSGGMLSVGNSVSKKDIKVYASFKDGSSSYLTDFEIVQGEIKNVGENTIYVRYQNEILKATVYGIQPKQVSALYATYNGTKVTVGSAVNPDNLVITATYKDGTSETINNYTLVPSVLGATGTQTVAAYYQGLSVSFNVEGIDKQITAITAKYVGSKIGVGYSVRPSDVEVTATYNDDTTGEIKEFNLLGASITYVGYHVVTVEVDGFKAEFIVQGVEEQQIDYSNACNFSITNGTNTAEVSISMPTNVEKTDLKGSNVNSATVTKVLSRAVRKSEYIAFEVEAVNEDIIEEFPLTMKITIPSEFKLAYTSVFYTPNRKSVIGQLNIDTVSPNVILVTIYNPGTYILSYKEETN